MNSKRGLHLVYGHVAIDALAVSMIGIFVPVYLLILGFTLPQVILYLLLEWVLVGYLSPLHCKIVSHIGPRKSLIIADSVFCVSLYGLFLLEHYPNLQAYYLCAAVLTGIAGGLYFPSLQSFFSQYMGAKKQNKKTGVYLALPKISSIIGPVIGGIVATVFGFSVLFLSSIALIFLALLPFYFLPKSQTRFTFSPHYFLNVKQYLKEALFLVLFGVRSLIVFVVLPVALYLQNDSLITLGILFSLILLLESVCTIWAGSISDTYGRKNVIRVASILSVLMFGLLGLFFGHALFSILAAISGFVVVFLDVPYESHIYEIARKRSSPLDFLAFKEFFLAVGRTVLFGIILLLDAHLDLAFYLASAASFLFLFF